MRIIIGLIAIITIVGCGQQNDKPEEPKEPSVTEQVIDQVTGKAAIDSYQHAKDVIGDIQTTNDKRASELEGLFE